MTPEDAATAIATPVAHLAGKFMLDPATYARGAELGYPGMSFYVGGRGGVLGDVDADVVSAAMVLFEPAMVRAAWEQCAAVSPAAVTGAAFAAAGYDWARAAFDADVLDWGRLADLAGRVVAAASPAGAPIFAGWRALPAPDDAPARVLHEFNALRELRFSLHAAALISAAIPPPAALGIRSPQMAALFGWSEVPGDLDEVRTAWDDAEARTNRCFAAVLAVLDPAELDELVTLSRAAWDSIA